MNEWTFEHGRNSILEVDETGHGVDAVLFGLFRVVDLDESDAVLVALVVDLLQLIEHLRRQRLGLVI